VEHVTSRGNPVVKRFREVARQGRLGDTVLLDGPHLLEEALKSRVEVEVAAFSDASLDRRSTLASAVARSGARVVTAPTALLEAIAPVRQPSGVVALARMNQVSVEQAVASGLPQLILFLESVQDPGNVGAIVRTAEGCGGTAVLVGPGCADPLGWKALRGSMGSAFRLPVSSTDGRHATEALRAAGVRILAAVPRGGTPLHRADLTVPAAILLGGEGAGLSPEALAAAVEQVTIEMRPPVESLNVSVAAALILYEASRQRAHVAIR
jgi:TrmH family RNA methyltransferase